MTPRRPHCCLLALLMLLPLSACDRPTPASTSSNTENGGATEAPASVTPPESRAQPLPAGSTTPKQDRLEQTTTPASLPSAAPLLKFEPAALDLGMLDPEKTVKAKGTITNISDQPVTLSKVQPSCACTDVRVPSGTLQPGESVEFDLDFTPKSGTGIKRAAVRFYVDGAIAPAEFAIMGEVSLPVRVIPPQIDARNSMTGTLVVQSLDGAPFRILNVAGMAPHFLNGYDPVTDGPSARYLLQWDLSMYDPETMPWWWVIETDRADAPVVDVRVWHEWTRPSREDVTNLRWVLSDQRVLLNTVRPGESKDFEVTVEPLKAGYTVETPIAASCPVEGIDVRLLEARGLDTGEIECTVRLTNHLTETGLLYAPVTIHAPTQSREVVVIGRVIAE
ncbi:MAG: DUF1573 domain-containing protein [Phycisphaerales bacterium]|nr:DUF1573 domain-containing protein [Phycisphaerales bacterium]